MDGIHGGRCSLITAALHVLLGTDCTARHPPPQHQTIPIWGCLEYSVVKISRQMQISHSADTMVQSYKCHCNFCFSFLFFLSCCLQQVEGDVSFLIWNAAADNRTAVKESFLQRPCFCSSCMWPEKVSRLLDSGFHLCLALSYGIPYHVLHHCSL